MVRQAMAASRAQQAAVSPSSTTSTSSTSATRTATTPPAKKTVRPSSPISPLHVTVTCIRRSSSQLSQCHLPRRRAGRWDPTQPSGEGPTLSCCCQYSPTTLPGSHQQCQKMSLTNILSPITLSHIELLPLLFDLTPVPCIPPGWRELQCWGRTPVCAWAPELLYWVVQ